MMIFKPEGYPRGKFLMMVAAFVVLLIGIATLLPRLTG